MHELEDFSHSHLPRIVQWFDDPAARRWLGGPDWAQDMLRLARADANRHGLIMSIDGDPAALLDVEVYGHASASFAIAVDPARRRRGIATTALTAMLHMPRFATVSRVFAGIELGNEPSAALMVQLGFAPTATPSEAGFTDYERIR